MPRKSSISRAGNAEKWAFYWFIINLRDLVEIVYWPLESRKKIEKKFYLSWKKNSQMISNSLGLNVYSPGVGNMNFFLVFQPKSCILIVYFTLWLKSLVAEHRSISVVLYDVRKRKNYEPSFETFRVLWFITNDWYRKTLQVSNNQISVAVFQILKIQDWDTIWLWSSAWFDDNQYKNHTFPFRFELNHHMVRNCILIALKILKFPNFNWNFTKLQIDKNVSGFIGRYL